LNASTKLLYCGTKKWFRCFVKKEALCNILYIYVIIIFLDIFRSYDLRQCKDRDNKSNGRLSLYAYKRSCWL